VRGVWTGGGSTGVKMGGGAAQFVVFATEGSIKLQDGPKNVYTLYSLFYMSKCVHFFGPLCIVT
jgi:hypothetical protein